MTAHSPPIQHSSTEGDIGFSYVFAEQQILEEIKERLDMLQLGLATVYGDVSGSGSDTLRVTRVTGIGFAEAFATMNTETEAITPTGLTTDYDSLTVARHGLAKEETQFQKVLNHPSARSIDLSMLVDKVPESLIKTMRQKVCSTGATIGSSIGAATTAWSFDDELDLAAAFMETEGFAGDAVSIRDPEQYTDLAQALRNEPAYQTAEVMNAIRSIRPGAGAFNFLGFRNFASHDVTQSGGGHVGFAYVPGAIGMVVANTTPIDDDLGDVVVNLPQFGLVIQRSNTPKEATARFDANAYFGFGLLSATLFPQRKLLSIDD